MVNNTVIIICKKKSFTMEKKRSNLSSSQVQCNLCIRSSVCLYVKSELFYSILTVVYIFFYLE